MVLDGRKDPSELHVADPAGFPERWQAAIAEPIALPAIASTTFTMPEESPWPSPLADEAYHGLAGEIVRVLEPASEADPAALLDSNPRRVRQSAGPHGPCPVEADKHLGNEFAVFVGKTSKARKGTSWGQVNRMLNEVEEQWATSVFKPD